MSHEIIRSLERIQDQVKQELQNVKTYRAFQALDNAIAEISEIEEEIARSLTGIRGQVVDRLNDVREYRALLAVEKSVHDIAEVLSVLEDASRKRAEATTSSGAVAAPAGQATDAIAASTPTAAAEHPQTYAAPATQTAVAIDHGYGYEQLTTPTVEVELTLGGAAHEADAVAPSVSDATRNPPSLSAADTGQTHEQEQHSEITGETAENTAANVPHEAHAASRSEADTFRHSTTPPAVLMDGQTHQPEQPPQPAAETGEKDANSVAQQGDAPESEDVGVARVA